MLVLLALIAVCSLLGPCCGPTGVEGGQGDILWTDSYTFKGNCSQRPVHSYFHVNSTAHLVELDVTYQAIGGFPGSDMTIYGPDSFVVDSVFVTNMSHSMELMDLTKRGRWSVKVGVSFCGPEQSVEFVLRISVMNRHLAVPVVEKDRSDLDEPVPVSMKDFGMRPGESYRLDLGNGEVTDWMVSDTAVSYEEPGTYEIKAMVQVADGEVTGWSEPVIVEVRESGQANKGFSPEGMAIAVILVIVLIILHLALRKG